MTTIAYKDGVIAYDSRSTRGGMISSDSTNKRLSVNGVNFFFAGSVCDIDNLIKAYFGTGHEVANCTALVSDSEALFTIGFDEGEFFKQREDIKSHTAIGSGTPFAIMAMDLGLGAIEAVKATAKRDINTGGRIRSFKIPGYVRKEKG